MSLRLLDGNPGYQLDVPLAMDCVALTHLKRSSVMIVMTRAAMEIVIPM